MNLKNKLLFDKRPLTMRDEGWLLIMGLLLLLLVGVVVLFVIEDEDEAEADELDALEEDDVE